MKDFFKKEKRENGQSMIIFAVALVVLLGFVAFAIDMGSVALTKSEMQNAADAAALAAAQELPDATSAQSVAQAYALENGMDVKTLSALLGHVSSETTLNIYSHITDNMRTEEAARIDRGIGKAKPDDGNDAGADTADVSKQPMTTFQPYKGNKRKPGTGCITQISDHCWEGRYSPMWPDGKKHSRNIYAKTREECEALLPDLITEMKAEIAAIKAGANHAAIPDSISKKRKAIAAYMRANPAVTNKSLIASESQTSRWTVQKYYDEIRRELNILKKDILR